MAGVPIKFRCYRCSQLLGVSRSKVGAVVSCPKCSAELVVPDPSEYDPPQTDDNAPAWLAPSSDAPAEFRPGALDTGVPLDFLDIRPEDIRVEPGHRPPPPTPPPRPRRGPRRRRRPPPSPRSSRTRPIP